MVFTCTPSDVLSVYVSNAFYISLIAAMLSGKNVINTLLHKSNMIKMKSDVK